MAFFRKIKQALGFSDPEADEQIGIDASVTPLTITPPAEHNDRQPAAAEVPVAAIGEVDEEDISAVLPEQIFETVVNIFNESLPGFLSSSVDAEQQRQYLYNALDSSMKEYLQRLDENARARCEVRWEQRRRNLEAQLEALRERVKKEEGENNDVKKLQLSAERQKRALNDRVRDLERQVTSLQAENEQFNLENKSLVNRLRLATVRESEDAQNRPEPIVDPELVSEVQTLRQENTRLSGSLDVQMERYDTLVNELKEHQQHEQEITEKLVAAEKEIKSLNERIEKSHAKDQLGNAMLSELNNKASLSAKQVAELEKEKAAMAEEIKGLNNELIEVKTKLSEANNKLGSNDEETVANREKLIVLTNENAELKTRLSGMAADLDKAKVDLNIVNDIQGKLDTLEMKHNQERAEMKHLRDELAMKDSLISQKDAYMKETEYSVKKKNEEILRYKAQIEAVNDAADKLRDELNYANDRASKFEETITTLRKTIEANLYEQAQSEAALRSEINFLKQKNVEQAAVAAEQVAYYEEIAGLPPERKRRGRRTKAERLAAEKAEEAAKAAKEIAPVETQEEKTPAIPTGLQDEQQPAEEKVMSSVKISAIDESLDNIDWLSPTPPPGKKKAASPAETTDSEFGYHEPERKSPPESPAQMSLW